MCAQSHTLILAVKEGSDFDRPSLNGLQKRGDFSLEEGKLFGCMFSYPEYFHVASIRCYMYLLDQNSKIKNKIFRIT